MSIIVPKYVPRFDTDEGGKTIEDRILDDIANPNDPHNVLIAGFPGVGKSSTARAIAARYRSGGHPAVILSVQNKNDTGGSKIALVDIGQFTNEISRVIAIPVVSVSRSSTNSEEVVNQMSESLKSLEKKLRSLERDLNRAKKWTDSTSDSIKDAIKIKEGLEKLLGHELILTKDPNMVNDIVKLGTDILGALPYVQVAIKIVLPILRRFRQRRRRGHLDELRKQNLLVVVDDLEDLGNNWQILSDVLADSFRYVFVTRIEDIAEYLKLIEDRTYSNRYLNEKNYHVFVSRVEVVPPPSIRTFNAILNNYEVRTEDIERLWSISGGIPAIALMILEEYTTLTSRDLEFIRQEISDLMKNKEEIHWSETDYRKRLAMALYATIQIFLTLIGNNKAYGLLCSELNGVTQDGILIFCGCQSENGVIYIPTEETETRKRIEEIITMKNCCPEQRKMEIRDPLVGGTNCGIGQLSKSIVKDYAVSLNESDLSNKPTKYSETSRRPSSRQRQVFYKFTGSFEHMPYLLRIIEEVEEFGYDISPVFASITSHLNQIRKTLRSVRECLS